VPIEEAVLADYKKQHLGCEPGYCFSCFLSEKTAVFGPRANYYLETLVAFRACIRLLAVQGEDRQGKPSFHELTPEERAQDAENRRLPPEFDNRQGAYTGSLP
jgi:hypothetical protein